MQAYHIHIKADTESDLKEELREAVFILAGLRDSTINWQNEYGHNARVRKKKYENLADQYLNKHKIIINK